jgi:hypothetical protein
MIAQKIATRDDGSLLAQYLQGQEEANALSDGAALRDAARDLLSQLPHGQLTLVTTTTAGVGLAATCAALRSEPTRWQLIDLMLATPEIEGRVAIVDILDGGGAWQDALKSRFPSAPLLWLSSAAELSIAA